MNKKRERQRITVVQAVLISAVLGLLGGLLSNIVANLINVPDGWEWLPISALAFVFLISLPITILLARNSEREAREGGTKVNDGIIIEGIEMDASKIRDIHTSGQVTLKDTKLKDSEISDIEAK